MEATTTTKTKNNTTTEAIKVMLEIITPDTYLYLTDVKETKSTKATLCVNEICDFTQWIPNSVITDVTDEWIKKSNGYTWLGDRAFLVKRWWADKNNIGTWRDEVANHENPKKDDISDTSDTSDDNMGYVEGDYKTKLDMVKAHEAVLKDMGQIELTKFGKIAGCDSRAGFSAYKKALLKIGIDYNALKKERHKEVADSIEESIDHEVSFYTDYSSSHGKMAVLNEDKTVIATAYDDLEQSEGEAEAIKLAIDEATKQRKAGWVRAIVYSDAKYLTWANEVFKPGSKDGGKARKVGEYAKRNQVRLEVRWIKGSENPADGPSRS